MVRLLFLVAPGDDAHDYDDDYGGEDGVEEVADAGGVRWNGLGIG